MISCTNEHVSLSSTEKKYYEILQSTDTTYTNHFPKNIGLAKKIAFGNSTLLNYSEMPMMYLLLQTSKSEYNREIQKLSKLDAFTVSARDTNTLVINNWNYLKQSGFSVERDSTFHDKLSVMGRCQYPIPNFWKLEQSNGDTNPSMLSDDFQISVFEAKKGIFLNSGGFKNPYIPKEWEHGYSKGIAFSDKQNIIIYWAIIW